MKPSERIRELFNTYDADSYMFAILDYLDEQAEKKEFANLATIIAPYKEGAKTKTLEEVLAVIPERFKRNPNQVYDHDFYFGNRVLDDIIEAIKKLFSN